jgi:hypothetical protein
MGATLLLNPATWDLETDAFGNIAVEDEPDSLAQDAASAIKLFFGEYYFDTTIGVPYLTQVLGVNPPPTLSLLKQLLVDAALTVPDVASAQVYISSFSNRTVGGQVQVISSSSGQLTAANFSVMNPQGV